MRHLVVAGSQTITSREFPTGPVFPDTGLLFLSSISSQLFVDEMAPPHICIFRGNT